MKLSHFFVVKSNSTAGRKFIGKLNLFIQPVTIKLILIIKGNPIKIIIKLNPHFLPMKKTLKQEKLKKKKSFYLINTHSLALYFGSFLYCKNRMQVERFFSKSLGRQMKFRSST